MRKSESENATQDRHVKQLCETATVNPSREAVTVKPLNEKVMVKWLK